ncbi:MAG: type II toxin-antitoxin system RelE/ParE family toxin [Cyclobacteriaceae bacterium]|jgi:plasmid stabilization system protein ParE
MVYKVIVSPRAQKEIENSIDYYTANSTNAPQNFVASLKNSYSQLAVNPYCRLRYKDVRSLKLRKFPFSLYFVIHESSNTVRVLSCFHDKRDPIKLPRS